MSGWARIQRAVGAADASLMADEVLRLGAEERREVARRLRPYIREAREAAHTRFEEARRRAEAEAERARLAFVRERMDQGMAEEAAERRWWAGPFHHHEQHVDWTARGDWIGPLRVAGAGTLGGAAAVADWLLRRDFSEWGQRMPFKPLLRVIAARPAQWQADLAVHLAGRLRGTRPQLDNGTVALALELLRRTGAEPPGHEPLVVAWVSSEPDLAGDPLARHLIPRLFEAEGVGRALRDDRIDAPAGRSWLRALTEAAPVDRELLVEGCVRRFLRGGSATDLRFFVRLHDLLDPAPTQERVRDYLRLLPAAPGPVADLALRRLRAPGVALSGEEVNEAVAALLFRSESKLVRAGLTLLDQAARDAADDLDHLAPALASAFLCESYEVRERSVRWAVKHARRFSPAGAETVREAAAVLPPDLAARLIPAYGQVEPDAPLVDAFEPGTLPAFEAPGRHPLGPAVENLAGTFRNLHHEFTFERWLDGFVRLPGSRKPPAETTDLYRPDQWHRLEQWTEALLREATAPGQELPVPGGGRSGRPAHEPEGRAAESPERPAILAPGVRRGLATSFAEPGLVLGGTERLDTEQQQEGGQPFLSLTRKNRLPSPALVSPPHYAMLQRCAEIHAALQEGTLPPYLLATPTHTSGHVDPDELVTRLAGYERDGVQPLPADLGQALLRLPREVDPGVAARAARLTSEAGATLVRWLKDRPEPETSVEWSTAYGRRPRARIRQEPTGLAFVDALFCDPPRHPSSRHGSYESWWWLVLPSDREVVAMHLMPRTYKDWPVPNRLHPYVTRLCHQDGPAGAGMALLLAMLLTDHGWNADHSRDLVLRAVATNALPATECGRQLGWCLRLHDIKPSEVLRALDECARRGAHQEVWQIMTGLLAVFLPGPGERAGTAHTRALEFALEKAGWAGARGVIPEVADIAARTGSSGFIRAARSLHDHLSG
ncbi:hypothetical protein SAMN05444920_10269 [Nonomuraea solani]|uniref:DUF7824 domain-containing protein n=1 Tax=Nonomuraea solani TaxID=1144553 RepID=A0A1H5XYS5_9ACTN|nr:DUF6493 family protein [Nonomuraea solani]SEG16685.1 hypothetical protein SAMN05444920_10269 [Nonomuraea solani]